MVKMTKAQARKRLKECKSKLLNVALEESFPISNYTNAKKCMDIIERMIRNLQ